VGWDLRKGWRARWAVGIGGEAVDARVSPRACLRFERTRIMWVCGREGVFWAFIRAWRFVPVRGLVFGVITEY
jgi:hypothetical protein